MDKISLSKCLKNIIDNRGKTCPTTDKGIPLIATNCIKEESIYPTFENVRYVSEETYSNWFRGHPSPGDILFVNKGTPGRVCLVPDPINFCIAQDMVALQVDDSVIYPPYLFAALRSRQIRKSIENMHVGTMIPHFKKGDFDLLQIPLPKKSIQIFIGSFYRTFSEKIFFNQKTNEILEEIAKALFKSWFIDFDPVKAKSDGHSTGLADEISNLFPDSFEDSELGLIPNGWKLRLSSDLYNVSIGKTPPRKEKWWFSKNKEDIPWLSIKDMGNSFIYALETSEFLTEVAVNKFNVKVVPPETVIVSFKLTIGRVLITPTSMLTNEAIAHFIPLQDSIPTSYSFCLFCNFDFRSLGSTSSIATAVNSKMLREMIILDPPHKLKKAFDYFCSPILQKIKQNLNESKSLEEIRDTLLPKLISGKLRITDAEKMIEKVGI